MFETMEKTLSANEIYEASQLIKDLPTFANSISLTLGNLLKQFKSEDLNTSKGLSFLDLKNLTLLNYVSNLLYVILQKMMGISIENDSTIERLAELRIVLEKMRPIDEKLKYQINKLLSSATSGVLDASDPLRFKANPDNIIDEDNTLIEDSASNVYVPPKISAAYFDDNPLKEGQKRYVESSKKRALSSSILYELQREYDVGPEEIKETINPYKIKLNEEIKNRTRYEEEYMTRLPMTKKQKHETKQLMTVTNFNRNFDDFSNLEMSTKEVSHAKRKSSLKKGKFYKQKRNKGKRKH